MFKLHCNFWRFLILGLVALAGLACYTTQATAAVKYVSPGQKIQAAIDSAVNGDVIIVNQGTYYECISFKGKAITVQSTNPDNPSVVAATKINGNQADSVVLFANKEGASSVLSGLTITNGKSKHGGGGICIVPTYIDEVPASPTINKCVITGNSTPAYGGGGGGIFCGENCNAIITGCTISSNTVAATHSGGGIFCFGASPRITNCTIKGNTALNGAGICYISYQCDSEGCEGSYYSDPIIVNCVIVGNSGKGIYSTMYSYATITNCTISGNTGGGYCFNGGCDTITNCVVWGNTSYGISPGCPRVTYSDVQGGYSGTGNINADPKFVNPGGGDYHITNGSPCINKGSNSAPALPATDIDGNARIISGIVDMGADEYLPIVTISATDSTAVEPGTDTGKFTVNRTGPTNQALTVYYSYNGTAIKGTDYTASPDLTGSITIPAGYTSTTITVTPKDDAAVEANETVMVTLSASSTYNIGSPSNATVNIYDNDAVVTIAATDNNASEPGSNTGKFRISRSQATASSLTVYNTISGTAANGTDYSSITTSRTIAANSTYVDITVTPKNDYVKESTETVVLTISTNAYYKVGSPSSATVYIYDND
ncbi:MAG: right-handed parallel beta-helix repeat-containing protein [Pseudomonadota bacterium]